MTDFLTNRTNEAFHGFPQSPDNTMGFSGKVKVIDNGILSVGKIGLSGSTDKDGYDAILDVSLSVGRTNGIQVNLTSSDVSNITLLKGGDFRITDSASTTSEDQALSAVATKSGGAAGVNGHGLWGGNFIANLTGGTTANIYGVYGEADAASGATVGGGGGAVEWICGLQGYANNTGATLSGTVHSTAVVGIYGQQTGATKGTAVFGAYLEGRLNQATTGVGALFAGYNFNNQVNPDFGLDFDTTTNGVALAFNKADIRLTTGIVILSRTTSPNGAVTAAQGSLCLVTNGSSTSTRAFINTDGGTTWTDIVTGA